MKQVDQVTWNLPLFWFFISISCLRPAAKENNQNKGGF
jgi:hypothetical protein